MTTIRTHADVVQLTVGQITGSAAAAHRHRHIADNPPHQLHRQQQQQQQQQQQ